MARDWTEPRLEALLRSELGDPTMLDGFRPLPGPTNGHAPGGVRRVRAMGPELCLQICAGTVPGVSVSALIRGLLLKSTVILKPGREDAVLPVLFHRGLAEEWPELAGLSAVVYWPGGSGLAAGSGVGRERATATVDPESAFLQAADAVVVYGSDEVVRAVRERTPITSRFVGYRHRVGAALVGREGLSGEESARASASAVAQAVAAYDQRGCVSPHVVYVEEGAVVSAGDWFDLLADALDGMEDRAPSGPLRLSEASELRQIRVTGAMREAAGEGVRLRHGEEASWTVVLEPEEGFVPSCTGRMVRIRPVADLRQAVGELARIRPHLQTVALEGVGGRQESLADGLAEIGVTRITRAQRAPWPPPWWLHDGQGPLQALLRWVELEEEDPAPPF